MNYSFNLSSHLPCLALALLPQTTLATAASAAFAKRVADNAPLFDLRSDALLHQPTLPAPTNWSGERNTTLLLGASKLPLCFMRLRGIGPTILLLLLQVVELLALAMQALVADPLLVLYNLLPQPRLKGVVKPLLPQLIRASALLQLLLHSLDRAQMHRRRTLATPHAVARNLRLHHAILLQLLLCLPLQALRSKDRAASCVRPIEARFTMRLLRFPRRALRLQHGGAIELQLLPRRILHALPLPRRRGGRRRSASARRGAAATPGVVVVASSTVMRPRCER